MGKHTKFLVLLLLAILATGAVRTTAEETEAIGAHAPFPLTFDMQPRRVNCGIGPKQALISAYLLDADHGVSGAGDMQIQFRSPSNTAFASATFFHQVAGQPEALVEGDVYQGLWQVELVLPQNAEEGIWELEYFFLVDQAGDYQVLKAQDMQAFGFVSIIEVQNTAVSLDLPMVLNMWSEATQAPTPSPSPTVPIDMPPVPPR